MRSACILLMSPGEGCKDMLTCWAQSGLTQLPYRAWKGVDMSTNDVTMGELGGRVEPWVVKALTARYSIFNS